ncbi:anti-sigma factor [soil metagenome]
MSTNCDAIRELAAGYVLDALAPAEEQAVREHLATCPEIHSEFSELGAVVPYLAEAVEPVEPPARLKGRLLAAAAAEGGRLEQPARSQAGAALDSGRGVAAARTSPRAWPQKPSGERRFFPLPGQSPLGWVAGITAVGLIFVLGAGALVLQLQLQSARQYEQGVAAVLELAAQEGSQVAILAPQPGQGGHGIGAIGADGRAAIAMRDLAPTTGDEVYEAWVIVGDAAPVAIGGFKVDDRGTGTLVSPGHPAPPGAVVALTREPAPGSTAPQGPIIATGTTAPGS